MPAVQHLEKSNSILFTARPLCPKTKLLLPVGKELYNIGGDVVSCSQYAIAVKLPFCDAFPSGP